MKCSINLIRSSIFSKKKIGENSMRNHENQTHGARGNRNPKFRTLPLQNKLSWEKRVFIYTRDNIRFFPFLIQSESDSTKNRKIKDRIMFREVLKITIIFPFLSTKKPIYITTCVRSGSGIKRPLEINDPCVSDHLEQWHRKVLEASREDGPNQPT